MSAQVLAIRTIAGFLQLVNVATQRVVPRVHTHIMFAKWRIIARAERGMFVSLVETKTIAGSTDFPLVPTKLPEARVRTHTMLASPNDTRNQQITANAKVGLGLEIHAQEVVPRIIAGWTITLLAPT
jgi:hypothetical protein